MARLPEGHHMVIRPVLLLESLVLTAQEWGEKDSISDSYPKPSPSVAASWPLLGYTDDSFPGKVSPMPW